jgi:hypothetical protein
MARAGRKSLRSEVTAADEAVQRVEALDARRPATTGERLKAETHVPLSVNVDADMVELLKVVAMHRQRTKADKSARISVSSVVDELLRAARPALVAELPPHYRAAFDG